MLDMVVFQRIEEADGAGPVENRVQEESPWNCDHSYCDKFTFAASELVVSAEEVVNEARMDRPKSTHKVTVS
jgi:hypothetical protein